MARRQLNPQLYDGVMMRARSTGFEPKVAQHTIQLQTTASHGTSILVPPTIY